MPIYLGPQESERAVVSRAVQAEQQTLGARGGEQARERARWMLDRLFVDGAVAVSNQLIFDAMQLSSHGPHRSTVPAANQQVTRSENSSEAGGPR